MNYQRLHAHNGMGYLPSPMPFLGSPYNLSRLKLNVTIYFTPELPFIPPALTRQPQKVVDVLKIMVVMDPFKTVLHLKQQIQKTIAIISKDENLKYTNLNLSSVRNSQNFVAHNEMVIGHAFTHDENIYAIVISETGASRQHMASPVGERLHVSSNIHSRESQQNQRHRHFSHSNASNSREEMASWRSKRNAQERDVSSEENSRSDSEDTYESSFVDKEEKQGYFDLEAEESDGSVSSDGSPSPKFREHVPLTSKLTSNRKESLSELKKRKSMIHVSESEEDDYPNQFKSHSHYVANLVESKVGKVEEDQNSAKDHDDKEMDLDLAQEDNESMEKESKSKQQEAEILKALTSDASSDESSESSDGEPDEGAKNMEGNEIVRESGSDSETESGSETSSTHSSGKDSEHPENDSPKNSEESSQNPEAKPLQTKEEPATPFPVNTPTNQKEYNQTKSKTHSAKLSAKRKYSSLSEIASNTSNHSRSPNAENSQTYSSSSSSSSDDSSASEAKYSDGKKVKRSSLKSLSKDVVINNKPSKTKTVTVKAKPKKVIQKPQVSGSKIQNTKAGKPISALLDGSSEFKQKKDAQDDNSSEE